MEYKMPRQLLDALLKYFNQRPYGEAVQFISALTSLPPMLEPVKEEETK
jgi:hypothetical protein